MKFVIITAPSSIMAFLRDKMSEASMRRSPWIVADDMAKYDDDVDNDLLRILNVFEAPFFSWEHAAKASVWLSDSTISSRSNGDWRIEFKNRLGRT